MSNSSLGQTQAINSIKGQTVNMPSVGPLNPQTSSIQYANNPLQSPQLQPVSLQGSPSQSPMGAQSHIPGPKVGQTATVDLGTQIISKARLQELVRELDPTAQIEEEMEEVLLHIADDFIDSAMSAACMLAKHRNGTVVEVKDLQMHLERCWNMWIPGFGAEELRPYKRSVVTEAHKQRMALLRKYVKKN